MSFGGVGVALVTPFNEQKQVDYTALEKLVNSVIEGGVDYLVALGTTAETPTLSKEEKKQIFGKILEINNGRKPVVCGVGGNDTRQVIEDLEYYSKAGAQGILSVTPYYNKPSQEGLFCHFSAIASATTLPVILYNVPGRTGTNLLPDTAIRLAKAYSNVVAIKEASGNLAQCMELVRQAPAHFEVLSGDDNLALAQIGIGMKGVISVAANCYPKTFCTMVHEALKNNFDTARQLHYQMIRQIDLLFAEGNPTGVKHVLAQKNIIQNELRLPLVPASEALAERFSKLELLD